MILCVPLIHFRLIEKEKENYEGQHLGGADQKGKVKMQFVDILH